MLLLSAALALLTAVGSATAEVLQKGNLRVSVLSRIQPFKLPRHGTAPIAVFVGGHIGTTDGQVPPQLETMTIDVNRHGLLQSQGLPVCPISAIKASSTGRSLRRCGDALVGSGRFWASVVFPAQRPYPTRGRLLIFNGRAGGKPALFAHIFTTVPFATSFVIVFSIRSIHKGPYGTELKASLPGALGSWGFVDRIKLTLRRKYTYRGKALSYFNSGCPALAKADTAVFPLARAKFQFVDGKEMSLNVTKSCRVDE
ncbi:MAG TPA: hypothetical protein VFU16_07175 [Solirubrobacterales bacterium]|nr:hypothetical protein [Solirubrobacterales bacterium]